MGLAEVYNRTETSSVLAPNLIDVSTSTGKKQTRAERRQAKRDANRERAAVQATSAVTSTPHVTHYAHGQWHWIPAEKGQAEDASSDTADSGDATTTNDAARSLPEMQHQAIATQAAYLAPAPAPQTDPVRAPAQVMRIFVAAWEDDTGSLHMPSTVFVEIAPRRWKVGSPAIQSSAGFRLFEGLGTQTEPPSDTAPRPTL